MFNIKNITRNTVYTSIMHVTRKKTEHIFVLNYIHHILSSDTKSQNFEFCPLSNLFKTEEHFTFFSVLTVLAKHIFLVLFTFFKYLFDLKILFDKYGSIYLFSPSPITAGYFY